MSRKVRTHDSPGSTTPPTPKIPRAQLPELKDEDLRPTHIPEAATPVKRPSALKGGRQQALPAQGETSAAGRGASRKTEERVLPTRGESSRSQAVSFSAQNQSPASGASTTRRSPKPQTVVYARQVPMKLPPVNVHQFLLPSNYEVLQREMVRNKSLRTNLHFDVLRDTRLIRDDYYYPSRIMSETELSYPASDDPDLTEMYIRCPHRSEPLHVTRREKGKRLRCIDIFEAIFLAYHERLTPKERGKLHPQHIPRYEEAMKKRCKETTAIPLREEREGLRRVDLLLGYTLFAGLIRPKTDGDWELKFHDNKPSLK